MAFIEIGIEQRSYSIYLSSDMKICFVLYSEPLYS